MGHKTSLMTVQHARELAVAKHAGQRDRDSSLHIDHVARVANSVGADAALQRVAWLHDVLEDCDVASTDLRGRIPDVEVDAILLLTHVDDGEAYADYVQRIADAPGRAGELARAIKEADMLDNLRRCARDHDDALVQYANALTRLWKSRPAQHATAERTNLAPVTIKGVCLDSSSRVLLGRNKRGGWELPGGRPNTQEPFADCLTREIAEETGLRVTVLDLISAEPFEVIPGRWVNVITYGCELVDASRPIASDEHDRVAFLSVATLPPDQLPNVYRRAIERQLTHCG